MLDTFAFWRLLGNPVPPMEGAPDRGQRDAIRFAAVEEGWSDPAVIYLVQLTCLRPGQRPTQCATLDLPGRLVALDPENAVAHLAVLTRSHGAAPGLEAEVRSEEGASPRDTLLAASRAERFDTYWTSFGPRVWPALKGYVQRQSPPELTLEDWQGLLEDDSLRSVPAELPLVYLWFSAYLTAIIDVPAPAVVSALCDFDEDTVFREPQDACRRLALLMRERSNDLVSESIGLSLAETFEPGWAMDSSDWKHRQARHQLMGYLRDCERPRWMNALAGIHQAAEDLDLLTTLIDALAQLGEREGMLAAARFEFSRYPERYDEDPARCRDILQASPAEQQAAIRRGELEALDAQEALLRAHPERFEP